jgi:uncharacterized BrkB/YihY/UPF0761 family membrane protein
VIKHGNLFNRTDPGSDKKPIFTTMKKLLLSLSLLLFAIPGFSQAIKPGQSGDMPVTTKYLILAGGTLVIVFILLYFRTQNRKRGEK